MLLTAGRVTQKKTKVAFSGGGTKVEYRLRKQVEFVPERSNGLENDTVNVPNIEAVVRIIIIIIKIYYHYQRYFYSASFQVAVQLRNGAANALKQLRNVEQMSSQ